MTDVPSKHVKKIKKKSFQQCSLVRTEENAEFKSQITLIKEKSIRLEQVSESQDGNYNRAPVNKAY